MVMGDVLGWLLWIVIFLHSFDFFGFTSPFLKLLSDLLIKRGVGDSEIFNYEERYSLQKFAKVDSLSLR